MKRITYLFIVVLFLTVATKINAQVLKTNLTITVLDDSGNIVQDATVTLYKTEADYRASKNPAVGKMMTDKKGRVKFKDLETMAYFIEVRKGDLSNDGKGAQTGDLVAGKTNKVNIIIE